MSKSISPRLEISLYVECPHCDHDIDLFDDENLTDEGWLYSKALPDGHWSQEHPKFELNYTCPQCEKEIQLKGIEY